MSRFLQWADDRTGCGEWTRRALYESIPGGARWRYVWGSTLAFAFAVQVVTGFFLWMFYSPSAQTAWESVFYIQNSVTGGWLLRGIHHFTAQVMTVLLVLHMMQVIVDGAYRAPREFNFWIGLILLLLVLALSLTGYLLPWDEKGYWATRVSTNLAGITPGIGPELQRLVVGGPNYGHETLTRFFAFHAGLLPALVLFFTVVHIYLFRRHGIAAKRPLARPEATFWPDQLLKDAVACLGVMLAVLLLVFRAWFWDYHAPVSQLGAELGAPADPSHAFAAARPEWYFLFLFQLLKFFPGTSEIYGALVIPAAALGMALLMPLIGRWKLGHAFNVFFFFALLAGMGYLTFLAVAQDRADPRYQAAVHAAEERAERVRTLALSPSGIPSSGALSLLRTDPLTQGPALFAKHCASCHRYGGQDGLGNIPRDPPRAPDLKGFASRDWLEGLFDSESITNLQYFGGTKFRADKMVKFVTTKVPKFSDAKEMALVKTLMAVSAQAQLPAQRAVDARDAAAIAEGRRLLRDVVGCTDCHAFQKPDEDASGPDLTGYGSEEWLVSFISDPAQARFYGGRNDRMPAYGRDHILDPESIRVLAKWIRQDWLAAPAASPPVLAQRPPLATR